MSKKMSKKAFTLIELIVIMAIVGILVLLATPKFMGYTKEAKLTKYMNDSRQLEDASGRYYMDKDEWPRLSDTPYTAEQIDAFAQKIYDITGKEVSLDSDGKYYDIDYNKLSKYVKINGEKEHYILQNPVGNVYVLQGLTNEGKNRIQNGGFRQPVTGVTLNKTSESIFVGGEIALIANIQPSTANNKNVIWSSSNTSVATVDLNGVVTAATIGTATITATTEDGELSANCTINVVDTFSNQTFVYTNSAQTFTVPVTGQYKLEAWGAKGGNSTTISAQVGGQGGYTSGTVTLQAGTTIYIYVGGMGGNGGISGDTTSDAGGWNGGGNLTPGQNTFGAPGGGATDFRLVGGIWNDINSLQKRILVAGGGGGANTRDYGYGNGQGGNGGGLIGQSGTTGNQDSMGLAYGYGYGSGGTQTSCGAYHHFKNGVLISDVIDGLFGMASSNNGSNIQSSGGGGYYGGGTSGHGAAGGGSSFVTGYDGCDTTYRSLHNGLTFTDVTIQQGGNNDHGKAKITFVGY